MGSKKVGYISLLLLFCIIMQMLGMFYPYLIGEVAITNDYMDIPEKTKLGGAYVDNAEYINNHKIGGLRIYIPEFEKAQVMKSDYSKNGGGAPIIEEKNYSVEEKEFIEKNVFEVRRKTKCGWFMHHHNAMLAPINEYALGKKTEEIDQRYGWLITIGLKYLLEMTGGVTLHNYFRILFLFFPIYHIMLLGVAFLLFRKIQYVLLAGIIDFSFLYLNYESIHFAPGFNPIRHLFDVAGIGFLFLFLEQKKYTLLLVLVLSILSIFSSKEFGLPLAGALLLTLIIKILNESEKASFKEMALIGITGCIGGYLGFFAQLGKNLSGQYYLKGISGPPISTNLFYYIFIAFSIFYVFVLAVVKIKDPLKYVGVCLFFYTQALLIYFVWNPLPNHFYSIASPMVLLIAVFLKFCIDHTSARRYETVLISLLIVICFFAVYVPSLLDYYSEKTTYQRIFEDHQTYQWEFPKAKIKSTMDPKYFLSGVELIKKYSNDCNSIYMISKYDNILPFLANKYSAMPYNEVMTNLVTEKEVKECVDRIAEKKPEYLFVDTDIDREMNGDIVNEDDLIVGDLHSESVVRVKMLRELRKVFQGVSGVYEPIEKGYIITVYRRKWDSMENY